MPGMPLNAAIDIYGRCKAVGQDMVSLLNPFQAGELAGQLVDAVVALGDYVAQLEQHSNDMADLLEAMEQAMTSRLVAEGGAEEADKALKFGALTRTSLEFDAEAAAVEEHRVSVLVEFFDDTSPAGSVVLWDPEFAAMQAPAVKQDLGAISVTWRGPSTEFERNWRQITHELAERFGKAARGQ